MQEPNCTNKQKTKYTEPNCTNKQMTKCTEPNCTNKQNNTQNQTTMITEVIGSDNGVEGDDAAMCITKHTNQSIYYFMTPRWTDGRRRS